MNRLFVLAGALTLAVFVTASALAEDDKEKKVLTIKQVMKATHAKAGLRAKYTEAAKAKEWDKAEKIAKDWHTCAENLLKNEPPKGDKEDFEKTAKGYLKAVKSLAEASEKMEEKTIKEALGTITKSCKTCHGSHKP